MGKANAAMTAKHTHGDQSSSIQAAGQAADRGASQAPGGRIDAKLSPIADIIADIRAGRPVILADDDGRENEGDIIVAADAITPAHINFMVTHGRGLVCLALDSKIVDRLGLKPMTAVNESHFGTAFTVSIGAKEGITTGISAKDRALTVLAAVREGSGPGDIVSPGHVFPLRARDGGVLEREGHTEAAADLAALAGHSRAAVICEVLRPDGEMARLPDLLAFGQAHNIRIGTIRDLIAYRKELK